MRWSGKVILLIVGLLSSAAHLFASTNELGTAGVTVALSSEEREWIARHPVMRVGMLTNWAPFTYIGPDGEEMGIDVDVLHLISQRTGLKFELVPQKSWEALVANSNQFDMTVSIAQSPIREQIVEFTKEYASAPLVIIKREGDETYGPAAILSHKKIALPRMHRTTQIVTNLVPTIPVILAETSDDCFELVAQKKADATVAYLYVASQYLNSHPRMKLTITGVIANSEQPLRLAVRRSFGSAQPVAILNKGLASISQQEMDEILAKNLMFGLASRHRVSLLKQRAAQVVVAAIVVGALLALWNYFMRKEILARRKAEGELRDANKALQLFSYSLSHDLRAPLRGINGFAQALKEDCYKKLTAEEQSYLDRIIKSGSHMDKMFTDILAYSRAARSEWPIETVDLNSLIHELIEEFPADQRHCFQIIGELPAVRGHATLLSECVVNLLSNAIHYVPSDRTPEVIITAKQDGAEVTIFVEDNGIGIESKDQKRIFEMLERAAPAAYKGTGIGLAVVAKAAERMGGSVGVESEVGKGSRFWIRLPGANAQIPVRDVTPSIPFWRRFVPVG